MLRDSWKQAHITILGCAEERENQARLHLLQKPQIWGGTSEVGRKCHSPQDTHAHHIRMCPGKRLCLKTLLGDLSAYSSPNEESNSSPPYFPSMGSKVTEERFQFSWENVLSSFGCGLKPQGNFTFGLKITWRKEYSFPLAFCTCSP